MITVKYDTEGNFTVTPKRKTLTVRQVEALERLEEWFTPVEQEYTIAENGWLNEVQ